MEHLSPVQESEVLVVTMQAYILVLGLPSFQCRNPDVNRQCSQHLALQTLGEVDMVTVNWVDRQEWLGNVPGYMAREEADSYGGSSILDIRIVGATAFDDVLASQQVVGTFFFRVGDSPGLPGATVEGNTDGASAKC